jgi:heme exporter protein A
MLDVEKITFSFGQRRILDSISFSVQKGQLLRISGPNGSGKSTLISVLLGLLAVDSGAIRYADDLGDFRRWVSWLPAEANGLMASFSAKDHLNFWLETCGSSVNEQEVDQVLGRWGLKRGYVTEQLPVGGFSTGMKRRLALAKLELTRSRLWFLDEPLSGLDVQACRIFSEMLRMHLSDQGAAIVVTHDERLLEGFPHSVLQLGVSD